MPIPANTDMICNILMKKRTKGNTIPRDNLPLSVYLFIHVANPKGQELVNKPWAFQTWAQ